jgi:hypothetical protein
MVHGAGRYCRFAHVVIACSQAQETGRSCHCNPKHETDGSTDRNNKSAVHGRDACPKSQVSAREDNLAEWVVGMAER